MRLDKPGSTNISCFIFTWIMMSHLKQISPILRVRNRTGLTAQPQSLEAIALKVSSDFTGSTSGQKKEFAPMLVFSSMSKHTRPSQVFRNSKGAGTVA
ncbi:hypothetical protein YSA_10848 [Pseudomonas putida ND6]|uniref:Uncharacterized protein n=1 Tax=Pseudomonas putida ND6 TaxID=231023 RepID=I3V4I4_PSEPU|nr:hypothetical protein YSA_10848 [Pseudomonas putida ND6]